MGKPAIDKYSFGSIVVEGEQYSSDIIIFCDHVESNWWRKQGHTLSKEDIHSVVAVHPDVIIIGTGYYGIMKVPPAIVEYARVHGIEMIVEKTTKAWKTYNEVRNDKNVVACLHLTC